MSLFGNMYYVTYSENECLTKDCGNGTCIHSSNMFGELDAQCSNLSQWMKINSNKLSSKTISEISIPG